MKIFISIKLQCLLIGILIFKISNFYSQNQNLSNSVFSSNIKSIKKSSNSISFNGSYRFLGYLRNQKEVFPNNNGKTLVILSGDYEIKSIIISDDAKKESQDIINDLIKAAYNNAKENLKKKRKRINEKCIKWEN